MGLTPAFKVILNKGKDITDNISKRLISLNVVDNAGLESDTVEVVLDDSGYNIALPDTGDTLEISLGYKEESVIKVGDYIVDEVELSGPPNSLAIRGKAADMNKGLKVKKTRTWQKPGKNPERYPLSEVLEVIASEHGLVARQGKEFIDLDYPVLNQKDESDLSFLTRLAKDEDAIAKPAAGFLIFSKKGKAKQVTGDALPEIKLSKNDVILWRVEIIGRGAYKSVKARYQSVVDGEEKVVVVGEGEPEYTIRKLFQDDVLAIKAASAKLDALERGKSRVSLSLPGNTGILAESKLVLSKFRTGVDGAWVAESVTHSFTNNGYSTSVEGTAYLEPD